MLEYYTGVPGSGKTYRAVDHVYNCFLDQKSKSFGKYSRFFTNINEFHFEAFNEDIITDIEPKKEIKKTVFSILKKANELSKLPKKEIEIEEDDETESIPSQPKPQIAYQLDMDALLISLTELRERYLSKATDSELMELADKLNLSNTLFVIDEAHNFFDVKNDVYVWWLSYHRHLHQDIILITQNLSLIYRKYLTFGEFFYRAVPSSLRIRSGVFTYHQFIKYQLYKTSHTDTIKVKFDQKVYALYGSGANTQSKKVIYKFIAIAVVLFVIVAIFFNVVGSFLGGGSSTDSNTTQGKFQNVPSAFIDRTVAFSVVCIGFDCSCLGQSFSLPQLNNYKSKYNLQSIETTVVGDGVFIYSFARNDKFLKEVLNVSSDSSTGN
ncbi:MAG: zonular occludens toxin domain-containing protein [Sulfurimonas sp.]|jgi:zona occludens toxin